MPELGAPGVKIEEISSGPRPISLSGTTDTGFVGLITIPEEFFLGRLRVPGQAPDGWRPLMPLPRPSASDSRASWQTALNFLPFTRPVDRKETKPGLTLTVNGVTRERKDLDALLRQHPTARLFTVKEGVREEAAIEGARAIRERLGTPGDFQLELKPGEVSTLAITPEAPQDDETQPRLADLVKEVLGDDWETSAQGDSEFVEAHLREKAESGKQGRALSVKLRRSLLTLRRMDDAGREDWVLAPRPNLIQALALKGQLIQSISQEATSQSVPFKGDLSRMVDDSSAEQTVQIRTLQELLAVPARQVSSIDSFEVWQHGFAEELFINLMIVLAQLKRKQAETVWKQLQEAHRGAWARWVRGLPGMDRLEFSVRGFFSNGGRVAFMGTAIQGDRTGGPDKFQFLRTCFDSLSSMAMLCAPGLDKGWQEAILNFAGQNGRGDLFAVLDTPRFFLTRSEDESSLAKDRWMNGANGYEQPVLELRENAEEGELRFSGFSNDTLLSTVSPRDDRGFGASYAPWLIVENPRSSGAHDRYVVVPPSGFVAGMIAATDLRADGGVHKAPANEPMGGVMNLVTTVSDTEQGILNSRSINIIRRRPFAGIRAWGARTVASDPLWRYVNVRRLFLMVERSVRDAIQWAVFRPNNDFTRADLNSSIQAFLFRLYGLGALDGKTAEDAFSVQCDSSNNPDADVRDGIMTVDVELRPVFPAEFIRVRFRQSPMRLALSEGR